MIRLPLLTSIATVLLLGAPLLAGHDCPWCSGSKSSCECKQETEPKETLGPGDMPCRLEGVWIITLCIECRHDHMGHTWLRYEKYEEPADGKKSEETAEEKKAEESADGKKAEESAEEKKPEVHTVGRYRKGHGGAKGVDSGEYVYEPAQVSGVIYDLDLKREKQFAAGEYYTISTTAVNPIVFEGAKNGFTHGGHVNNCVTHVRDGWHHFTGEWYELPSLYHTSEVLLERIACRHPDIMHGH